MQHLEAERLAALDHDAPTCDELAHLAACSACRTERDAYAALVQMAQHAGDVVHATDALRLISWDALSDGLRDEGLLTSTGAITPMRTPVVVRPIAQTDAPHTGEHLTAQDHLATRRLAVRRFATSGWTRAAAALALMASSAAAGRLSAGWNSAGNVRDTQAPAAVAAEPVLGTFAYASIDDATTALSRAQNEYERASLWLASNDTTTRSADVYRARLAALDQMMAASKAALRDAPQDPVLTHYFLTAYTAREATLQQLGGALPVDRTIETY